MKDGLTARQEYVLAQLYTTHRWSVPKIAKVLELGRRQIENILKGANVALVRRSPHTDMTMTDDAARNWFAEAGRPDRGIEDPEPPVRVVDKERVVYRRRRCQHCGRLNAYSQACTGCGKQLDYEAGSRIEDPDVLVIRVQEERRGLIDD